VHLHARAPADSRVTDTIQKPEERDESHRESAGRANPMNAAITASPMVDISELGLFTGQFPVSRTLRPSYRLGRREQTRFWYWSHGSRRIG
jgi:hypothetical protein